MVPLTTVDVRAVQASATRLTSGGVMVRRVRPRIQLWWVQVGRTANSGREADWAVRAAGE